MSYKITALLLTVAYCTGTQSAFLVNCPTNYYWNVQYHMCEQQNYCGGAAFGWANQYCGINYAQHIYYTVPASYYTMFNYYSACQTTSCSCYHSACQEIQTCYVQLPCICCNTTPIVITTPDPIITTTTKNNTHEDIKSTTSTPLSTPIPLTTTRQPERTTQSSIEVVSGETSEIDIKLTNVIHSYNYIHNPVYVSNTNKINHQVFTSTEQPEITKKPETRTTISPVTTTTTKKPPTEPRIKINTSCCRLSSPKLCKQRYDASWFCYHRSYRRCGTFCYRANIYLRPRQIEYHRPILVMPPSPQWTTENNYNDYDYQSATDCSGCVSGGYHCSSECYRYNCKGNRCGYIDQEYFCHHFGGFGCEEHDGYFSNDYF